MISPELKYQIYIMTPVIVRGDSESIFKNLQNSAPEIADYTTTFNLRAGVKFKTGDETYIEGKNNAIQSVRFKIRYNAQITENQVVKWGDDYFNILFIEHERFKRTTYLHTEKIVKYG